MPDAPLTVVDLYCGAGGLSVGLRQAGLKPVFAADSWGRAVQTYRKNLGDHAVCSDVGSLTADAVRRAAGLSDGEVGLVCGGPPCQGFSVQRRGPVADARNDQVLNFVELALAIRPRAVLMENVPGLLGRRGKPYFEPAVARLEAAGYSVAAQVLEAADYGVPSHRRRAIVIALRDAERWSWPEITHGQGARMTVRDALADLPEPTLDHRPHPELANHVRVRISDLNRERISHVPEGGGRLDIPPALQLPCHRNAGSHRHLDVFGRMRWDRPGPTITAVFDSFSRGRFAHPEQDRAITGREGARLQSFPDEFVFEGAKKEVARQIGNAVPPRLARALGEALAKALGAGGQTGSRGPHRARVPNQGAIV